MLIERSIISKYLARTLEIKRDPITDVAIKGTRKHAQMFIARIATSDFLYLTKTSAEVADGYKVLKHSPFRPFSAEGVSASFVVVPYLIKP